MTDNAFLDQAVREGKFTAARKPFWAGQMKKKPKATRAAINAMSPIFPAVGTATEAYPMAWLSPSDRKRIEAARNGQRTNAAV